VSVPNLKNTGLSSATVGPLCGASGTNESLCTAQAPLLSTTGNVNKATGTTANTYQQLGGNISITTPAVSYGTNGKWLVTVEMPLNQPVGGGAEYVYGCIASASTFTLQDATTDGASNCVTTLTNSFAGGPGFSSGAAGTYGPTQLIKATMVVNSGTTFTAQCWVAGSTTTSLTVYGYCHAIAAPY
jgi:hypothetical protein